MSVLVIVFEYLRSLKEYASKGYTVDTNTMVFGIVALVITSIWVAFDLLISKKNLPSNNGKLKVLKIILAVVLFFIAMYVIFGLITLSHFS